MSDQSIQIGKLYKRAATSYAPVRSIESDKILECINIGQIILIINKVSGSGDIYNVLTVNGVFGYAVLLCFNWEKLDE